MKTVRSKIRQAHHSPSNQMQMPPKQKKGKAVLTIFLIMVVCFVAVIIYTFTNTVKTMDAVIVNKETKQVSKTYLGGTEERVTQYIFHVQDSSNKTKKKSFTVPKEVYEKYTLGKTIAITYKLKEVIEVE